MNSLIIATQPKMQLSALLKDPPHALLLVGATGIGKGTVANAWAKQICKNPELIEPDEKGTITIEAVRSLYKRTRGKQAQRQVVIVEGAERMGIEAQNAFLKLLEEPRQGVTFILTTPSLDLLLPTITSRAQDITLQPIPQDVLKNWAIGQKNTIEPNELTQLLFIAQGRPATLASLLKDQNKLASYKLQMQTAKKLLSASAFERLAEINALIKDKASLIIILEAMAIMVKLQLSKNADPKWLQIADGLEACLSSLAQNGNPRAQLTRFFLSY